MPYKFRVAISAARRFAGLIFKNNSRNMLHQTTLFGRGVKHPLVFNVSIFKNSFFLNNPSVFFDSLYRQDFLHHNK
jgi:hypothetical protein